MEAHAALYEFFLTGQTQKNINYFFYSSNRGEAAARLPRLLEFCLGQGFGIDIASLIVSCCGELSNNSFDHNMGYWKDQPGCCMSWSFEADCLTLGVADRGRGIVKSLQEIAGANHDAKEVLKIAWEKVISGRAPEKRGNGLKFTRKQILSSNKNSLICFSNHCIYQVGIPKHPAVTKLSESQDNGVLTYLQWALK